MWTVKDEILVIRNLGLVANKLSSDAAKEIVLSHFTERTTTDYIFYLVASDKTTVKVTLDSEEYSFDLDSDAILAFSGNCTVKHADPNLCAIKQIENFKHIGFGSGTKKFLVSSEVRDLFTINIKADTEDEAIALANSLPMHLWDHPDINEHLTQRVMVRMARWGNVFAREVS